MLELLTQYQYTFLFFGLLIGGETVLVPAVYLAITGVFSFSALIIITISATLISDSLWYTMGRWKSKRGIQKLQQLKNKHAQFVVIETHFYERPLRYLFISKFVYGTRILAQILSGVSGVSFPKYLGVNVLAVLVWTGFLTGIGYIFRLSFEEFGSIIKQIEIFALFLIITIGISLWLHRTFKKKWFQR